VALASLIALVSATPALASVVLPARWSAGGALAGNAGIGNSSDLAADTNGNIAIVSGPAHGRGLGVTSYDAAGQRRWQISLNPSAGTYSILFHEIVAVPGGDFIVAGYYSPASSSPLVRLTLVRLASDGTVRWRVDPEADIRNSVGKLVVDSQGNAYLAFVATLHKYGPTGALMWERPTATLDYGTAISPDESLVVVTGATGGMWRTTAFDAATGAQRWAVVGAEGIAATSVVIDTTRVYVAGQGRVGWQAVASVVAYDRATGARVWRTDSASGTDPTTGLFMAPTPRGGLVVAADGAGGGYWWTVALDASGAIQWEARRDLASRNSEAPTDVLVLSDGTTVVTGGSGPEIADGRGNTYLRGVTVGYSPTGVLLWEAYSTSPTRAAIVHGDGVCATGGDDALITCFSVPSSSPTAAITATPMRGAAPLTVVLSGRGSMPASAAIDTWAWTLGDGASGAGVELTHVYTSTGVYDVRLVVTDTVGASGEALLQIVVDEAVSVDGDGDGVSAPADCDDTNAAIHPGATESCNDVDDDCDGVVDDGLQRACCGAGVAMCSAGAWSTCSVSCPGEVDAGSSVDAGTAAGGDGGVAPPIEAASSCASMGARGDVSIVLLGVLAVGLVGRRRRREVTRA
jgi:PKD repeat protein